MHKVTGTNDVIDTCINIHMSLMTRCVQINLMIVLTPIQIPITDVHNIDFVFDYIHCLNKTVLKLVVKMVHRQNLMLHEEKFLYFLDHVQQ